MSAPVLSCPDFADWLSACGGCYSAGGGLLLGQSTGVGDQQRSGDMHEKSREGQLGPREYLRDDGGEVVVLGAGAGAWLGILAASHPLGHPWESSILTMDLRLRA